MIGPVAKLHELGHGDEAYSVPASMVAAPAQEVLNRITESAGALLGLVFLEQEAFGYYFVVPIKGGGRRRLEREHLYALVPLDEVRDAPAAFVRHLHALYGPGRAWTLAGRVGFIDRDGALTAVNVDGVRHLLMRMFFVHEFGREHTVTDVQNDGEHPSAVHATGAPGGEVEETD